MEQSAFGPISGSARTRSGISRYAWLVRDRGGAPHTIAISSSADGPGSVAVLAPLLGRRFGAGLALRRRTVLRVRVDGAVKGPSLPRPGWPEAATASEPFTLEDGTELRVLAESADGGRKIRCDVYVDGRTAWSGLGADVPIEKRLTTARMSRAAWAASLWAWLSAVAGGLLLVFGLTRQGQALPAMATGILLGLAMVPVILVVLVAGAFLSRGRDGRFAGNLALVTIGVLLAIVAFVGVFVLSAAPWR